MYQLNKVFVIIPFFTTISPVYSLPPPRIIKKIVEDVPTLIQQSNKTSYFKSGETANLHCIFAANSKLIHPIEWNKLDNDVNNVSSYQYASVNDYKDPRYLVNNSELIITNVNSKDEGKYYCVAKTKTGMNYGEIELFVTTSDNDVMAATNTKQTLKNEIMIVKPAVIGIACIAFLVGVSVIIFVRRKCWNNSNSHSVLPQFDSTSQTLKSSHYTANFY